MAKKTLKAKEPIRLREKQLSNGNKSLYLDIYRNGKREYEFLKLYLIPETAGDLTVKERNKQTIIQANAIKAQRIIELTNDEAGIKNTNRAKMLLSDWMKHFQELKANKSGGLQNQIAFATYLLKQYGGDKIRLCDVDKSFCEGFLNFITNEYVSNETDKPLSKFTANNYYLRFNCALNYAVRSEIIPQNPMLLVEKDYKPQPPESQRIYLTIDEVKRLIETECKKPIYKRAFLFSCFCGLRVSDVARLKWSDINTQNGQMKADIRQKKTDEPLYLPLSENAAKWMPERSEGGEGEPIFKGLSVSVASHIVKDWARAAGITKNVTFHTARHTFATMLLTKGGDLFTVSKLLGHKDISTTQVYAKIVDQKKTDTVNLLNDVI